MNFKICLVETITEINPYKLLEINLDEKDNLKERNQTLKACEKCIL